jgi:hypothetical protein
MNTAKLVIALNTMIENFGKITEIHKAGSTYFFRYLGKQTWAIQCVLNVPFISDLHEYRAFYFPGDVTPQQAALGMERNDPQLEQVSFSTSEIKTTEARETFSDLYRRLGMKEFNIDRVLDEIIQAGQ